MRRALWGIAIRGDEIAAVRNERGTVARTVVEREGGVSWGEAIAALLSLEGTGSKPCDVYVVVADRRCRVGILHGEHGATRREAETRFGTQPDEFFAGAKDGWVPGPIASHTSGWQALVVDRVLYDGLVQGAERAGATLVSLRSGTMDESLVALAEDALHPAPVQELLFDLIGPTRRANRRRRLRQVLAIGAALSLAVAAMAPTIGARQRALALELSLVDLERRSARSERTAWIAAAEATTAELAPDYGRSTAVLDLLSRSLPDSVAVATLRVDQGGGSVTLVGIRVLQALPILSALGSFEDLQLSGAVTREVYAGTELQQATLKWSRRVHPSIAPVNSRQLVRQ